MAQNNVQQIETIEHPASGQGREFPPFEKQTFPSQLFWLALTFILLYLLMSRVALPRISSILEERRKRVEADLAEAQRRKDESDATILAGEEALADARARAQTLANETHEKAAAAAEARRKEVDAKLASRVAEADKDHCRYAIGGHREGAWCCERGRGRNRRTADRHRTSERRGQRSRQQRSAEEANL